MGAARIIGFILMGVFPIFELVCYQIMRSSKSDISLRKRNTTMIHICTIAAWLAYFNLIFGLFGGIYCGVYHIFIILLPPLTVGPQLLRGVTLYGMLEYSKFMLEYGETTQLKRTEVVASQRTHLKIIQEVSSSRDDEEFALSKSNGGSENQGSAKEKALQVRKMMKQIVKITKILLVGLPLVLVVIMLIGPDKDVLQKTDFSECFPEPKMVLNIGRAFTILFTVAAIISVVLVRHCNDALGIRREITRNIFILLVFNVAIFATTYFKKFELQLLLCVVQQMMLSCSMIIIPCCFSSGTAVLNQIRQWSKTSIPGYGRAIPNVQSGRASFIAGVKSRPSPADREREREMTMSLDAGLCVLLSSDEGMKEFTEHCSREFSVENIRYWCVVNDFHRSVDILRGPTYDDKSEHDESDIRAFAEEIFEKYVRVESELQINISASQRRKIEEEMTKSSRIEISIFDNAQKEIYAMMGRHSYPRFLTAKFQEKQSSLLKQSKSKRTNLVAPST